MAAPTLLVAAVAVPVIGLPPVLVASKNAMSRAPMSTVSTPSSGRNRQGRLGATLVSKATAMRPPLAPGARSARPVVPFSPVAWQNSRYSGTLAQASAVMKAMKPRR